MGPTVDSVATTNYNKEPYVFSLVADSVYKFMEPLLKSITIKGAHTSELFTMGHALY